MTSQVRSRPGGRSARVREAVLAATVDALAESGIEGLSIAEVALRAGVHETSIYRRWGSRQKLALDALLERRAEVLRVPDTGTIRADLALLGQRLVEYGSSPVGAALSRIMASHADDADSAVTRREFWDARYREVEILTERAKARGELPQNVRSRQLMEVFIAPIHFRLLLTRKPIDREFLAEHADVAVAGVVAVASHSL